MITRVFQFAKKFASLLYTMSDTEQLRIRTHSLAISKDLVENIFLKALLITNSSDLSTDLLTGHASTLYNAVKSLIPEPRGPMSDADIRFSSPYPDTRLHCETTERLRG